MCTDKLREMQLFEVSFLTNCNKKMVRKMESVLPFMYILLNKL